jgi:hypothetical protein
VYTCHPDHSTILGDNYGAILVQNGALVPAHNSHETEPPYFPPTARYPTRRRCARVLPLTGPSLLRAALYRTPPPPFNWCAPSTTSPSFFSASTHGTAEHLSPTLPSSPHESHQNRASSPPKRPGRRPILAVVSELAGRGRIVVTTTFPPPFTVRTTISRHCFDLEPSLPSPPFFGAVGPSPSHDRPPEHRCCLGV